VNAEGCEPYLDRILDFVGADRLLFASDYPHPDHELGEEVEDVLGAKLPDTVKGQIFWDNAARFYGLDS
jgi:predicted TIM-barrel fold metal-dependent hydrolase